MSDRNKKFHEFALKSILFKGRSDWYFCYLKSEKIAHVLTTLAARQPTSRTSLLDNVAHSASQLPHAIAHFVAGEMDIAVVLADIFSLLSAIRLASTEQTISIENGRVLLDEYESIAEKLSTGNRLSPFISSDDFSVPMLPPDEESVPLIGSSPLLEVPMAVKDTDKGQGNRQVQKSSKGQVLGTSERMSLILSLVRKNKRVSIKDISSVVRDCSEKTIQRELALLIEQGLVRKEGERRWSLYLPT